MTEPQSVVSKPPPLHERSDVFDEIASLYNGGNNLELVQERFHGALQLLRGTAIPRGHEELVATIKSSADVIFMSKDKDVLGTIAWIDSEEARHAPKSAPTERGDRIFDHADRKATELGAVRRASSDGTKVA